MKQTTAIIIGSAFTTIVLVAYLIYGYNLIKDEPNDQQVQEYIENSDTLLLKNIKVLEVKRERYSQPIAMYSKVKSRKKALVKAENYQKYFSLETYDAIRSINVENLKAVGNVYAVVNRKDFNNPKFGSKEKPLSVLLFYTREELPYYYVSQEMYLTSVKEYMTFIRNK